LHLFIDNTLDAHASISKAFSQIPYATEQRIISAEQGIRSANGWLNLISFLCLPLRTLLLPGRLFFIRRRGFFVTAPPPHPWCAHAFSNNSMLIGSIFEDLPLVNPLRANPPAKL
jgi:hypothetical protein